ncbi:unnamed protein product [Allacma fusca]|uniref:Uncharacterized protein n=1 Tax=Allacma fusca TaxID=39272 RepID=A0A8J2JD59_9HEXA|nr:unnamed protein product [Allacma fusca]
MARRNSSYERQRNFRRTTHGGDTVFRHFESLPRPTQDYSNNRHNQVTSKATERKDALTLWKVEGQAVAAGLGSPAAFNFDRHSIVEHLEDEEELHEVSEKRRKGRETSWRQKAHEELYIDLTFIGSVKTGMELLDDCGVIYLRAVDPTDPAVAGKPGKKVFEILDHNGYRLYLMAGKKLKQNAMLEFTWYDYRGHEILKTTGKFGGFWGGKMEIWLPSEDLRKDSPIGIIVQKCSCQPKYRFETEDNDTYTFEALKGQQVCCSSGKHAPHEFDILDTEFEDLVGSIYKLKGYVNFGNRELEYGDPIPNFDGCGIQFSTSELGSQTKAMMICGAFLLSVQHFEKRRYLSWSCCSICWMIIFSIILITLCSVGLISFFLKDKTEDKNLSNVRVIEREDKKGTLIFQDVG